MENQVCDLPGVFERRGSWRGDPSPAALASATASQPTCGDDRNGLPARKLLPARVTASRQMPRRTTRCVHLARNSGVSMVKNCEAPAPERRWPGVVARQPGPLSASQDRCCPTSRAWNACRRKVVSLTRITMIAFFSLPAQRASTLRHRRRVQTPAPHTRRPAPGMAHCTSTSQCRYRQHNQQHRRDPAQRPFRASIHSQIETRHRRCSRMFTRWRRRFPIKLRLPLAEDCNTIRG